MGEQQVFVEDRRRRRLRRADPHRQRHARKLGERRPAGRVERERHQRRSRLDDAQAELARDPVTEVGRADLRDRQAAGGDHQRTRGERSGLGLQREARAPRFAGVAANDRLDAAGTVPRDSGALALLAQHRHDAFGAVVAEQLALVLLVKGDPVATHQIDEASRRIRPQRGACETRVLAGEALVPVGRQVGEVAAAAARDADLLGQPRPMVDHRHAQAALPGDRCAEQPGCAGADHDQVEGLAHRGGRL